MTGDVLASTPEQAILSSASPVELASTLQRMEVDVLAKVLFRLTPAAGAHVFAALPTEAALRVLESGGSCIAERLLPHLSATFIAPLIGRMAPDRRAILLRAVPPPERHRLADALPGDVQRETADLLAYPAESAAGMMTTAVVRVNPADDAAGALQRVIASPRFTVTDPIFVVEPRSGVLRRVLRLRQLLAAYPGTRVDDLGTPATKFGVRPEASMQETETALSRQDLPALPVITSTGALLGAVQPPALAGAMLRSGRATRFLRAASVSTALGATTLAALALAFRAGVLTWGGVALVASAGLSVLAVARLLAPGLRHISRNRNAEIRFPLTRGRSSVIGS
jgi:magnesium transporter